MIMEGWLWSSSSCQHNTAIPDAYSQNYREQVPLLTLGRNYLNVMLGPLISMSVSQSFATEPYCSQYMKLHAGERVGGDGAAS